MSKQKDNSTLARKVALRLKLLPLLDVPPVVLETHGGMGRIFERCYGGVKTGVVFELDEVKAETLAGQRPSWAVYLTEAAGALGAGVGSHLAINVLGVDPYGEPWPVLDAFFSSERPRAKRLVLAVNDGLRHKLIIGGGAGVKSLAAMVAKYGVGAMYRNYAAICRELLESKAAQAGYTVRRWTAYHCGAGSAMTHFGALLELAP